MAFAPCQFFFQTKGRIKKGFKPEEIAGAELKAVISELIKARNESKLSQRDLEKPGGHTKKKGSLRSPSFCHISSYGLLTLSEMADIIPRPFRPWNCRVRR